ncbi:hypothetical protein [Leptolyngbya sp. PCC 6406]|uniref:hypothetical protein n=1 Tax=Leptolyngbya sp. PCC 6406 TaxID=1173264 RepID=UPI0002ABD454|nr:hypothetical protein [Leptolyngbya sp. PCC 6406]
MAKEFGPPILSAQQQEEEAKLLNKNVLQHFQTLKDPRVKESPHPLLSIVTIASWRCWRVPMDMWP